MAFIRHIGTHGDRKLAVVFREVPGEPHMALVVYTELLNRTIHDPLMKCIESEVAQQTATLADVLNRSYTTDGHLILQRLHREGQLKKVQTEQIVMTPASGTRIKLNELNTILDEMEKGEAAVKKLAEMDKQLGMQDPIQVARRMRGGDTGEESIPAPAIQASGNDALGDDFIANNLRSQAERMTREANGLIAEANRLLAEANTLVPTETPAPSSVVVTQAPEVKKSRGRPKKTVSIA